MPNIRLMPPGGGPNSMTVNGRTYVAATGGTVDVPDYDANVMMANGWVVSALGGVGTTAARPMAPYKGQQYNDTTVGAIVVWNGKAWVHHATGAAS